MIVDQELENKEIAKQYKELLRISYQTLSEKDKKMIRLAFDTAVEAHSDQRRKSGEAYIFHPITVAKIVAQQIGLDATSICAALLHDVVEDTRFTLDDIERLMGNTVAKIVHGLTKISSLKKDKNISLQAENFRKMLLTLNDDVRVIIIKNCRPTAQHADHGCHAGIQTGKNRIRNTLHLCAPSPSDWAVQC